MEIKKTPIVRVIDTNNLPLSNALVYLKLISIR